MSKFTGLLKREWFEHRSAFTWGPAVVLLIVLLAGVVTMLANQGADVSLTIREQRELNELTAPAMHDDLGAMELIAAMTLDVAGSSDAELRQKMAVLQMGVAQPFHMIFIILATFALLASLYDERKDASILFWKSMPVSDAATVASKLVFVTWVAPLTTICAVLVAQFLSLSLVSLYVEEGMGARIWVSSQFWWQPLQLVAAYVQLGIWLLPFTSWIMLVSAAATKLPALWAFGIPWMMVMLERMVLGSDLLATFIAGQLEGWRMLRNTGTGFAGALTGLFVLQVWAGVSLAVVFFALAVHFRRRNNEI